MSENLPASGMEPWGRSARFLWRLARNVAFATPLASLLVRCSEMATHFGPADTTYAWRVFGQHYERVLRVRPTSSTARRILEVGPGQNLGTSLLWWAIEYSTGKPPTVVLWDVYRNAAFDATESPRRIAGELLASAPLEQRFPSYARDGLRRLADGDLSPDIRYLVCSQSSLKQNVVEPFDLIYSQATLEHVWHIRELWRILADLTAPGGYHSHRVDLADHGRRHTNYLEMCEWPDWAWWLTQRFTPGALNRWRASDHLARIDELGLKVLLTEPDVRESLPVPRARLAPRFAAKLDVDLRTTGLWLIAQKP